MSNRSANGGLIVAIIALLVICVVAIIALIINPSPPNHPPTPTASLVTETATTFTEPSPIPTGTTVPTLPPTISPTVMEIQKWKITYVCNGTSTPGVQITGIVISGGIPPYWIEAFYSDGTTFSKRKTSIVVTDTLVTEVRIDQPIGVSSGRRIKVVITSDTQDGKPELRQDLYFSPKESGCP